MSDTFEIPVSYKGEEIVFGATLVPKGYTYCIEVDVYGDKILFEPDEERRYRAVLHPSDIEGNRKIDIDLVRTIAAIIEEAVK